MRFISLKRREFGLNPPRRQTYNAKAQNQFTSQVWGVRARSPSAPALAQRAASSLILVISAAVEGLALSKTQSFRCFQIIHGVNRAMEARPFRTSVGVFCLACSHQSMSESSWLGPAVVIRSQDRISCQVCLAKGHSKRRWRIVSGAWSQSGHRGWCWRPRRAKRSAVQYRSWLANQWKNFTLGGAQFFHMSFHEKQVMDPWKVAR